MLSSEEVLEAVLPALDSNDHLPLRSQAIWTCRCTVPNCSRLRAYLRPAAVRLRF